MAIRPEVHWIGNLIVNGRTLARPVLCIDRSLMGLEDPLGPEEAKSGSILLRRMEEIIDALNRGLDPGSFVRKGNEDIPLLFPQAQPTNFPCPPPWPDRH